MSIVRKAAAVAATLSLVSAALFFVQCSSFEEDTPPGTTPAADATTGSDASADAPLGPVDGGDKDSGPNCIGTLDDDFDRADLLGGKWDTAFNTLGDGGILGIFGSPGDKSLGVKTAAGGEQLGGIAKQIPANIKSFEVDYEQSLTAALPVGDAGPWFSTLVSLLVDTSAGRYTLGTIGVGDGSSFTHHVVFSLDQDAGPRDAKPISKLTGSRMAVRMRIDLGPNGVVEVRAGTGTEKLDAKIGAPITGVALLFGIGASGEVPVLQTAYSNVHACWR